MRDWRKKNIYKFRFQIIDHKMIKMLILNKNYNSHFVIELYQKNQEKFEPFLNRLGRRNNHVNNFFTQGCFILKDPAFESEI